MYSQSLILCEIHRVFRDGSARFFGAPCGAPKKKPRRFLSLASFVYESYFLIFLHIIAVSFLFSIPEELSVYTIYFTLSFFASLLTHFWLSPPYPSLISPFFCLPCTHAARKEQIGTVRITPMLDAIPWISSIPISNILII